MTRVLAISADRSNIGIHVPGSAAYARQKAYAEKFGSLDIIGFTLLSDGFKDIQDGPLRLCPTNSASRFLYGISAVSRALSLPKPDVITVQDPFEAGVAGLAISLLQRVPLHVQVHTDFLSPEYARFSRSNRLRVHIAGFVLRRASRIRVVSERIKESIQRRYGITPHIEVLPIFVDLERFRHSTVDENVRDRYSAYATRMLFVGRLEREKNPALAVNAFAKAAPKDACLIVAGEGSEIAHLKRLVKEYAIESRTFFVGNVDPATLYPLADIVLVPSRYEGYGLVIVEALAAGIPVLATDVGVAREAGAIIANESEYVSALRNWHGTGARKATLTSYPYSDFNEYVAAYCQDIERAQTTVNR